METDHLIPSLSFDKGYEISFPSRKDWVRGGPINIQGTSIYTDGSKMSSGVGAGIYSEKLRLSKSIRLPNTASVFQAEVLAIKEACKRVEEDFTYKEHIIGQPGCHQSFSFALHSL